MIKRILANFVINDLEDKMVFIGGPRQVGKTTLARDIIGQQYKNLQYLNWDFGPDRQKILNLRFNPDAQLVVFDEIHKYRLWKSHLKGIYDKKSFLFKILVTGSARLNIYRRGGDSLLGRNYFFRLHPFSVAELLDMQNQFDVGRKIEFPSKKPEQSDYFQQLFIFGGFPEPMIKQNETWLRRWHIMRTERIIREDIRDIKNIKDISSHQLLIDQIPTIVSSLLSIKSLSRDLPVTHKTIGHWLDILEHVYFCFRIPPITRVSLRVLKKMPKIYLWDWSGVTDNPGAKLENLVACHLLKFCHFLHDVKGYLSKLYYLRDADGREIDFIVTISDNPWFAVEVKSSGKKVSKNLKYFSTRLKIPFFFQVVQEENVDFEEENIRVISISKFLSGLV